MEIITGVQRASLSLANKAKRLDTRARMEAGAGTTLEEALYLIMPTLELDEITLHREYAANESGLGNMLVYGRLTFVLAHLLKNAIKFMDKPAGKITIRCVDEKSHWKFSVTDNGPGIDKKYHERIFQIFQTLTPRDVHESTGIGLALVKKIVELHGGTIWIESMAGEGCTFFFTLPKEKVSHME